MGSIRRSLAKLLKDTGSQIGSTALFGERHLTYRSPNGGEVMIDDSQALGVYMTLQSYFRLRGCRDDLGREVGNWRTLGTQE